MLLAHRNQSTTILSSTDPFSSREYKRERDYVAEDTRVIGPTSTQLPTYCQLRDEAYPVDLRGGVLSALLQCGGHPTPEVNAF